MRVRIPGQRKKSTRRSVSMTGELFAELAEHFSAHGVTVCGGVSHVMRCWLTWARQREDGGMDKPTPVPLAPKRAYVRVVSRRHDRSLIMDGLRRRLAEVDEDAREE